MKIVCSPNTCGLAYSLSCLRAGVGSCDGGNPGGGRPLGVNLSPYGPPLCCEAIRLLVICASAVVLEGGVSGRF